MVVFSLVLLIFSRVNSIGSYNCDKENIFFTRKTCISRFPGLNSESISLENVPATRFYDIPVFVIAFNNPTFVSEMVRQIDCYNTSIVILDAGSSFQPFIDYLKAFAACSNQTGKNHKVGTMNTVNQEYLPYAWYQQTFKSTKPPRFAALTDADIKLNPFLPPNFLEVLAFIAENFSVKAGFALNISQSKKFWPGVYHQNHDIRSWEQQWWSKTRERTIILPSGQLKGFMAGIDSTFAVYDLHGMYRCLAKNCGTHYMDGIRMVDNFTADHVPWEIDFFKSWDHDEVIAVYFNSSILSTTAKLMKVNGYSPKSPTLVKSPHKHPIYFVKNGTRFEFENYTSLLNVG